MTIANPILKGFNPDPSICRVGEDYYIATSTFEWFPGVQIHHSKDLKNWRLVARPLNRVEMLDMRGNPDSGGVWAPQLSYHAGQFWLIYSDMKVVSGPFKEGANYLTTCTTIDGDWSDPVYLNSSGFDPSMFHDDDGKQYLVNMFWDHREGNHHFYGIVLQQYSNFRERLVGQPQIIFKGTDYRVTEAPHLYKIGDYYYLLTAEGGTGYGHMATIARSKDIQGPYEVHPENPLITSRFYPENTLQKAGHASIVQAHDNQWYMVYLMGRPAKGDGKYLDKYGQYAKEENLNRGYCSLGRETSIAKLEWRDDWPYAVGGNQPSATIETDLPEHPWPQDWLGVDHFDDDKLNIHYQTLRIPLDEEAANLTENPGHLRLYGKQSLTSTFTQAHVARRWESLNFDTGCAVAFEPKTIQQMAGLTNYYNTQNWTTLCVAWHEEKGRVLDVMTMENGAFSNVLKGKEIVVPESAEYVHMKAEVRGDAYTYHFSFDGSNWQRIDAEFDTYKLSDDFTQGAAFTGAFAGMFCMDGSGVKLPRTYADFDYFVYQER
ncbi:MAG: glycoside hydrolase family 43 protein [Defluviitaleaceae bacterium]|nr:glycoside hydrolase family 43 protein [Defluviitaleaceae bacterium]